MADCSTHSHWDARFFNLASQVASWSKDPRKKVGAVLVSPDCRRVAWGYNGAPAGFDDNIVMMDRDAKNRYMLHAESNAIANAQADVSGWTLYVTEAPCLNCALEIHRAGVKRLCSPPIAPGNWAANQQEAEDFLQQVGVDQERFNLEA